MKTLPFLSETPKIQQDDLSDGGLLDRQEITVVMIQKHVASISVAPAAIEARMTLISSQGSRRAKWIARSVQRPTQQELWGFWCWVSKSTSCLVTQEPTLQNTLLVCPGEGLDAH